MDKANGTELPASRCPTCGAGLDNRARCTRCLLLGALETWTGAAAEAEELAAPVMLLRQTQFAGYELLGELGRGGMGVVFKARQKQPARDVALKVIAGGELASPRAVQRFHTEAKAAAALHHPNIVSIHEVGEDQGWHYFSMRLVEGSTLADALRDGPLPGEAAARLMVKLARAVHYAHQRGILHRDLKPTNILLDTQGEPHLTDFGLAKVASDDSSLTLSHAVLGTPAYMAPEQATGGTRDVTVAADVYGLGAILYEVLAGRPPFTAESTPALLRKIVEEEPQPITRDELRRSNAGQPAASPATRNSKFETRNSQDLSVICFKCLEKEPSRRYASSSDLADDLERWLRHEPILARPSTAWERTAKWVRRNRTIFTALAAVALLLVAGTAVSTWQAVRATRAEREQNRLRAVEQAAKTNEERLRREAEARSYAADINLAQQALSANNVGRARALLKSHWLTEEKAGRTAAPSASQAPHPSPLVTDLRGWEWRYLWQQAQNDAEYRFATVSNSVSSLSVSADGHWLAVGQADGGGLVVYDLRSRAEVARFESRFQRVMTAFSPMEPLLAYSFMAGSQDAEQRYSVRFWNAATREFVGEISTPGRCERLQFSADGRTLLLGIVAAESRLMLWRVADRTLLRSVPSNPEPGAHFAGAEDLSAAAEAVVGGGLRWVDFRTGQTRWTVPAADERVMVVAVSPDRSLVATGAGFAESTIRLWAADSGRELGRLYGHVGYVRDLRFLSDGKTLLSASSDQTIRLWDVAGRRSLAVLRGHPQEVWSLALLPDQRTLLSGAKDGSVLVWDLERMRRPRNRLTLPAPARGWAFGSGGKTVLLAENSGAISEWSGPDFQKSRVLHDFGAAITRACFTDDGRRAAVELPGRRAVVWDLPAQHGVAEFSLPPGQSHPKEFSASGDRLCLDDNDSDAADFHEWDLKENRPVQDWLVPGPAVVSGGYSPDEQWRIALNIFGAGVARDLLAHTNRPFTVRITQADSATLSPDGKLLAVTSVFGYVGLWEWPSLREAGTLLGFLQGAHSVRFSPDGRRLAAGSNGREAVKLWDLATQRELITLEGEGSIFSRLRFSPDGNVFGARNAAGIVHLWRAPSFEEITAAELAAGK